MTAQQPRIGITMGDPAGIGPEIVAKYLARHRADWSDTIVIGDLKRLRDAALRCDVDVPWRTYTDGAVPSDGVGVLDLDNVPSTLAYGKVSAVAGGASLEYVTVGTKLALDGRLDALVTAPLNKEAVALAGFAISGHTEYIAKLAGVTTVTMLLASDTLRVAHVTTHLSLREAIDRITSERIEAVIGLLGGFLRDGMGIVSPRIAVAGLNPHAGESGLFGREDDEIIRPVCERLRDQGVIGPLPPDTVFLRASTGEFDGVVAQYHDQGHIPIKMQGLDKAVNVTLGLPFLRASVDHGTAYDIAGTGRASPSSFEYAVNFTRRALDRGA